MTIVTASDMKFGFYTSYSWESPDDPEYLEDDADAFMFRVANIYEDDNEHKIEFFDRIESSFFSKKKVMCNDELNGPIAGNGDLFITSNCDKSFENSAQLGNNYALPAGVKANSHEAHSMLAGSKKFKIDDYEVFVVLT